MNLEIFHLFQRPEFYPEIAKMIHNEFWKDKEGHCPQRMEKRLRTANSSDKIPLSFIALESGKPVGTVNMVENDDENREHLTPWLAALVVKPHYRGKGIGSKLVQKVLSAANELQISELYLGTDQPEYYLRLSATVFERVDDNFCIMSFKL